MLFVYDLYASRNTSLERQGLFIIIQSLHKQVLSITATILEYNLIIRVNFAGVLRNIGHVRGIGIGKGIGQP